MDVIPIVTVHNPDENFVNVVSDLDKFGFKNIIVVNVDSDNSSSKYFEQVKVYDHTTVLYNEPNKGRGRALKIAFKHILDNDIKGSGVVTVNGYNEFDIEDVVKCSKSVIENNNSIIMGSRNFKNKEFPKKARFGNFLMSMVCKFAIGCGLSDPLTGLRAVPYKYLEKFSKVKGEMYDYDTNMLLEAKEEEIDLKEVKVDKVYLETKIAEHYKPVLDAIRICSSILKFIASSIVSSGLDQILYAVIMALLSVYAIKPAIGIFIATVVARVSSSFLNYAFNKRAVFKSDTPVGKTLFRYYVLCITQMAVSYFLVFLFSHILNVVEH